MMTDTPRSGRFSSQRLSLSYVEWGRADGPILILVHGGRDQKRSWDWVARSLAEDWRVIAFDLRGHGESDWVSDGQYAIMDHVFDLACLIETLDAAKVTLIGHSLGGNIVLRYAGLFPDRIDRLVAIEGLGPSPKLLAEQASVSQVERLREWVQTKQAQIRRKPRQMASISEAETRMRAAHPQLSEEQSQHLTRFGVRDNGDGSVSWRYDPSVLGRAPSDISNSVFKELWKEITCPVWLVYGAESWASNPEKDGRAAYFQNAKTTVIEGAGHWVHHDQLQIFCEGLAGFLSLSEVE